MAHFQKLPVNIDAILWNGATVGLTNGLVGPESRLDMPFWMPEATVLSDIDQGTDTQYQSGLDINSIVRIGDYLFIGTSSGVQRVNPGDWIIQGIEGELYPCTASVFDQTYARISCWVYERPA